MKILAIIGTPTKEVGYTTQTVSALGRCLSDKYNAEVNYLYLEDIDLGRCQGHLSCVKFGENECPFSSDLASVTTAMEAADGVIFASPVHCFNVSTLMKNFIDLYVWQMHRPTFFGKKAIVVTSAAGAGHGSVLKYLRKTFAMWGFEVVGQLGSHAGLFDEARYQAKFSVSVDKLAGRFAAEIQRGERSLPGLAELINFRVWRSVIARSKDASPYDWKHWQESGWLDQDYYFPVRVNFLANGVAAMVEAMIGYVIRNVKVKPVT